ncbi:carboxymuconolactone decarboxylase family protein [Agrococcus pavilionensis]|uniref:carboxymuconolactone decarboxylase family protein n=1 Tax=Agrococcus pavilionensis TaxID=1346502 RepID=UPI0009DB97DF|nr:hypothetical protein [Agrococcus pavilionensis]
MSALAGALRDSYCSFAWGGRLRARRADPDTAAAVLRGEEAAGGTALDVSERTIAVVSALAGALRDSYCSFAWGGRLARATDPDTAAAVLRGEEAAGGTALDVSERTIAAWARRLARDPNSTTAADVAALRDVGLDDRTIVALTAYIAARIAFSTVNDALGALPDAELHASAPDAVRDAISWGRAPAR